MIIKLPLYFIYSLRPAYNEAPAMAGPFEAGPATGLAAPDGRPAAWEEAPCLFTLGQNHPNPHPFQTTIPFTLTNLAEVKLAIFDPAGRKLAGIVRKALKAGEHSIVLNLTGLGLNTGNYVYQLQISNANGVYQQQKLMTTA